MGALLREFKQHVKISASDVELLLELALEKRNFLMHHYFRKREDQLRLERDRLVILNELVQIGSILEQAAALVGSMRVALSDAMSQRAGSDSDDIPLFSFEITLPNEKT